MWSRNGGTWMGTTLRRKKRSWRKFLALDAFFEAAVGGGENADIDFDGAVAADAFEFAFLEEAEQLGLDLRGNLADFVEEDGAAVGQFETAFALVERAGEGAFFVAEEFAFDEVFGDGGAVDLDEGSAGAGALAIEGAGDQFLAGAAFAGDEDGGLGAGDFADRVGANFPWPGLALQIVTGIVLLGVAKVGVDLEELGEVVGLLEGDLQLIGGEGLEQVIERAVAHAVHRGFNGAEAGDHDNQRFLGLGLQFAEQVGAFAIGEADIEENEVEGVPGRSSCGRQRGSRWKRHRSVAGAVAAPGCGGQWGRLPGR